MGAMRSDFGPIHPKYPQVFGPEFGHKEKSERPSLFPSEVLHGFWQSAQFPSIPGWIQNQTSGPPSGSQRLELSSVPGHHCTHISSWTECLSWQTKGPRALPPPQGGLVRWLTAEARWGRGAYWCK